MILTEPLIKGLLSALVTILVILFLYCKWSFQYWRRHNLPYIQPSFPFGNLTSPLRCKEHIGVSMQKIYLEIKRKKWKHGGIYFVTSPTYFVVDLDYVKNVMTKDFHYFSDRGVYYNEKDEPISAHLFTIGGRKWKNLRTKLTPTFTSGKMKMMFQTLLDCEKNLRRKMEIECEKKRAVDVKEVLGCFTTDIIGSCAFGLDLNTSEKQNSSFRVYGKKIFISTKLGMLKGLFFITCPNLAKTLRMTSIHKDVADFFMKVVKNTVEYREKNNYTRKDFMQMLIDLKKLKEEEEYRHDGKTLTMDEVAAQCFVFFLAGFETSSTTMSFALFEMAKNPDIQETVREEINTVLKKYEGKITYKAIQELKYMDQVINETLRKYPPVPLLTRKCVQNYKIPDEDIVIEKGTTVAISVLGIHHDEEYYPDPDKFDPGRFSKEKKKSRHHYAHIPFGEGPRICIGMRFGLMQSKVGLTSLLKYFKFTVNEKTKEPLTMQMNSFVLAAEGGIWLDVQKI